MTAELSMSYDDDKDPGQFFLCEVRLGGRDYFLVWHTAESDSFLRDQQGHLLVEHHEQLLRERVESPDIRIELDPPAQFDFDKLERWCANPDDTAVDCNAFLSHWNFLEDLAVWQTERHSTYRTASKDATDIYGKLFFGSNLPAITPAGEEYVPNWTEAELDELCGVLAAGIELFKTQIELATNQ